MLCARRKSWELLQTWLVLELLPDRFQHGALLARQGSNNPLQLVDVERERTEALDLPQQSSHIGTSRVSLLNGDQVIARQGWLESHGSPKYCMHAQYSSTEY